MKKNTIILTTLLAAAAVSGASLTNIDAYIETSNETDFKVEIKDVTKNYDNIIDTYIEIANKFAEDPTDPEFIEELEELESMEFKNMKIIIPNIKTLDLSTTTLSTNPDTTDDQYAIGFKTEVHLRVSNDGEVETIKEPNYLSLAYGEKDGEEKFLVSRYIEYMDKNTMEDLEKPWTYDLSSFKNFLIEGPSIPSIEEEEEVLEKFALESTLYMMTTANLLIEGEANIEERDEGGDIIAHNQMIELENDSPNRVSLYGQRNTEIGAISDKSNHSLYEEKYLLASDTFSMGLSGGAIAGIVVGSIAGIALLGGGSY